MIRSIALAVLVGTGATLVGGVSAHLSAQDVQRQVALAVDPSSGDAKVELRGMLDDPALRSALDEGLPLRILITTELWKDRFLFDAQVGTEEWRASVVRDPLSRQFRAGTGTELLGDAEGAADLDEVGALLHQAFEIGVRPVAEGRYYYRVRVEVETLSTNDLEELRRWLRGDLAPAVGGDEVVGDALFRGLGRVFVKMLKLPSRSFQLTSSTFSYSPGALLPGDPGLDPRPGVRGVVITSAGRRPMSDLDERGLGLAPNRGSPHDSDSRIERTPGRAGPWQPSTK